MSISFTVPDGRRVRFVHIPKTGGTWVKHLLKHLELTGDITDCTYDVSKYVGQHGTSGMYDQVDVRFCVVRHPITWYESAWRYQCQHNWKDWAPDKWHPFHFLDKCASDDFDTFVSNCMDEEPSFVTRMYEWYIGAPDAETMHYIGRQEKLPQTVASILLLLIGKDFQVPSSAIVNASEWRAPLWDCEQEHLMRIVESPAIRRFYSGYWAS